MNTEARLLQHLASADWEAADKEIANLAAGDFEELVLEDALLEVCHHDFREKTQLTREDRCQWVSKLVAASYRLHGEPVLGENELGDRALEAAVIGNDALLMRQLLDLGARAKPFQGGRVRKELGPVLYAMGLGHVELLETLLEYDGNLLEKDTDGCFGLFYAVANNQHDMIRFLVKKGMKANATCNRGRTPLMSEMDGLTPQTIDLLLSLGASLLAKDHEGKSIAEYAASGDKPGARYLQSVIQHRRMANATTQAAAPARPMRF